MLLSEITVILTHKSFGILLNSYSEEKFTWLQFIINNVMGIKKFNYNERKCDCKSCCVFCHPSFLPQIIDVLHSSKTLMLPIINKQRPDSQLLFGRRGQHPPDTLTSSRNRCVPYPVQSAMKLNYMQMIYFCILVLPHPKTV